MNVATRNDALSLPVFESDFEIPHLNPAVSDQEINIRFIHESGKTWVLPAYYHSEYRWGVRFYAPFPGHYEGYVIFDAKTAQDIRFAFHFTDEDYRHPLYEHGLLRTDKHRRTFAFADGTRFDWLGDTWWMALARMQEHEFRMLLSDRQSKGFTLVQIVAGPLPDMEAFDPRGKNETGWSWYENFSSPNPRFFERADRYVQLLVEAGIVPCIVGMWGYHLTKMGETNVKRHWRELIARWSAYPVIWVLAGETSMPWYLARDKTTQHHYLKQAWGRILRYVKSIEPYGRPIGAHPIHMSHREIDNATLLDFEMLQVSHGGKESITSAVATVKEAFKSVLDKPIVMSEINYEGILSKNDETIQRWGFWVSLLNGVHGFSYGANGIWQVNRNDKPFGKSPGGNHWGDTPWQVAMDKPGSLQIAQSYRWVRQYCTIPLAPLPEGIDWHGDEKHITRPFCAQSGDVRVVYCYDGKFLRRLRPIKLYKLRPHTRYRVLIYFPATQEEQLWRIIRTDRYGRWSLPRKAFGQEWVLVLLPLSDTTRKTPSTNMT